MTSSPISTTRFIYNVPYRFIQWGCFVYMAAAAVVYVAAAPARLDFLTAALQSQPRAVVQMIGEYVLVASATALGWFLFYRGAHDRMALLTGLLAAVSVPNISGLAHFASETHPAFALPAALVFLAGAPVGYLWFVTFPKGRAFPSWGKWWVFAILAWEIFRYLGFFVLADAGLRAQRPLAFAVTVGLMTPGFLALWVRYRYRASATQRQQTKWVVLGTVAAAFGIALSLLARVAARFSNDPALIIPVELAAGIVVSLTYSAATLTIAFAVTRRGLWDIDLTLNRSLVMAAVTVILAALFGSVFFAAQGILRALLGDGGGEIAAAAAALAVGAAFNPIRGRVRHFVDRRLYRLRFDLNELERGQQKPEILNPGSLTGRVVGGYELLGLLGRGGMGEVYKGFADGKLAAVKILRDDHIGNERFRQRFVREGAVTLRHPNIVQTYRYGETDGIHYIALEYVEGQTLRDILKERGRLPLAEIQPFLCDFGSALDTAHAQGYVHRDITPGNIMLRLKPDRETYEVVLMDFGIAKIVGSDTSITGSEAVGTIDYMSPEQIMNAGAVDHRTDIYSLGIVLYETLTGERPFDGTPGQVLFAHIQQPPPNPQLKVPELPDAVSAALLKALAKDPADRFQTAQAFMAALMCSVETA